MFYYYFGLSYQKIDTTKNNDIIVGSRCDKEWMQYITSVEKIDIDWEDKYIARKHILNNQMFGLLIDGSVTSVENIISHIRCMIYMQNIRFYDRKMQNIR